MFREEGELKTFSFGEVDVGEGEARLFGTFKDGEMFGFHAFPASRHRFKCA